MTQRVACFTGRFQPFHNQHLEVLSALSHKFDRIIIAITNPDIENLFEHAASQHRHTDAANPFSYESRVQIIEDSISELTDLNHVEIEIIPFDLTQPSSWAVPAETVFALRIFSSWEASKLDLFTGQGFEVLELPAPATKLSASDIREALTTNDSTWHSHVAPGAVSTIQQEWDNATSKVSA
ncbi:MAG: adenylyltransferase/cytidyltransferase family protein [Actinobacteria bacterium]|nr:adenylyltransferase/cytidyltransferase family protein [Actinomycetota bacterium]